jgi:hypothetical protein
MLFSKPLYNLSMCQVWLILYYSAVIAHCV